MKMHSVDFDIVSVEDDCEDQAITPMPKNCIKWECQDEKGKYPKLVKRKRYGTMFHICPQCAVSYGIVND